jgi:hypothetical protein
LRTLAIAVLVAVPLAVVGWVVHQGMNPPPPERMLAAAKPAAPPGAAPGKAPPPAAINLANADSVLLALFDGLLGAGEKAKLYDSNGLFDYIDGGAPVFIERGFRRLAAAELKLEGSDVVCDVYDMAAPENSTAIFNKEKSANAKPVENWPAAISGAMSFVFHSGAYYIKLTAFDAKGEAQLPKLAQRLKEKTATPPVAVATGPSASAPAAAAGSAPAPSGDEDKALTALFDGELGGAKVKEKVAIYDSKGLFDFIDGGAPVFIERGFRKLAATELASADGADLECAIYDMAKPENAKAIFEKEKSAKAQSVDGWDEAIAGNLSFVFWSDRYYVKLTAFDAKGESALFPLAKALRRKAR